VNIRGIGLMDSVAATDLTKGWHVNDIENVVLTQVNGVPIQVKDVAKVSVGHVPRLGIAGKDHDSDVALAIVVMGRTYHTNDVIPRIKAKIDQMNSDGSCRRESSSFPTTTARRWWRSPRTRCCTT
jgi:cobalt-zinc-cadmium resistance protein CzcA